MTTKTLQTFRNLQTLRNDIQFGLQSEETLKKTEVWFESFMDSCRLTEEANTKTETETKTETKTESKE